VVLLGYSKLNRTSDNPVPRISVDVTPERVARGERFARLCAGCHAADDEPPLEGRGFLEEDAPPVGTFYGPNLTPAHLADWTDGEIIRAIREGIHRSVRSLLIMPSRAFRNLSDDDVHAIVAYLRSQPAVKPDTPPVKLNVLGAIMVNIAPILEAQPPVTEPLVAPPEGLTAEYGEYLSSYSCPFCHGPDLRGDEEFGAPDLAGVGLGWTEEQFLHFMRTGLRPDGSGVDGDLMPWEEMGEFFREEDLRAISAYIGTLGAGDRLSVIGDRYEPMLAGH
jgi:mono/diheme cytochrome c family protein